MESLMLEGSILGPLIQASTVFKLITYANDTSLVSTLLSFTNYTNNADTEYLINKEQNG